MSITVTVIIENCTECRYCTCEGADDGWVWKQSVDIAVCTHPDYKHPKIPNPFVIPQFCPLESGSSY